MNTQSAQAPAERMIIESFDAEFARLHQRSCRIVQTTPVDFLYCSLSAAKSAGASKSVGEYVLRSAGAVEQTFGGITSNLWDDPFEWTLPETLSTPARVIEYLGEVEKTRQRAFISFTADHDLLKRISTPSGEMSSLINLLLQTLVRALSYQGRAVALRETFPLQTPLGLSFQRHP